MAESLKAGRGKRSLLKRTLWATGILALLALATGTWLALAVLSPTRIREEVESTLTKMLDRPIEVERARIDWRGRIHADGIRFTWRDTPLGGDLGLITDVDIIYGWHRIALGREPRVVHLIEPQIDIGVDVPKLQSRSTVDSDQLVPDLSLPRIVIHGGAVTLDVEAKGFERRIERITGIDLKLSNRGKLRGDAVTEFGKLAVLAHLNPFSVELTLQEYELTRELPHPFLGSVVPNWGELAPLGKADVQLALKATGEGSLKKDLRIAFANAQATMPQIGLPLEQVRGEASFDLEGDARFDVRGELADARIHAVGSVQSPLRTGPAYDIRLGVEALSFEGPWLDALDRINPAIQKALNFEGSIDSIDCRIFETDEQRLALAVNASMDGLGVSYAGFPSSNPRQITGFDYPIRRLRGTIGPTDDGGHALRLSGRHATAKDGDPRNILVEGRITGDIINPAVQLRITGVEIPLDDALYRALPTGVQPIWQDLSPSAGTADTSVRVRHIPGRPTTVDVDAHIKNGSARYASFPYDIDRIEGKLWIRGRLAVLEDFVGRHGDGVIRVSGELGSPDSPDRVSIRADDIALDDELRQTLEGLAGASFDDWGLPWPRGAVDVEIEALTDRETKTSTHSGFIDLDGLSLAFDEIPLAATDIRGRLELEDGKALLREVEGRIPDLDVVLRTSGQVELGDDRRPVYELEIESDRLQLDEALRDKLAAWRPDALQAWETFRPRGAVGLLMETARSTEGTRSRFEVEALGCELAPPFVPHEIRSLNGRIEVEGTRVRAASLKGQCGETTLHIDELDWDTSLEGHLSLSITAEDLDLDDQTFANLPDAIRRPIEDFRPRGSIDITQLALERTFIDDEASWTANGELELHGVQLSPIDLSDYHGRISIRDARLEGSDYDLDVLLTGERVRVYNQPVREFMCEVSARPRHLSFTRISGKVYRGVIHGDESYLVCDTTSPLTYKGRLRFGGVRLKDVTEQQFPRLRALRGKTKGTIDFEGAENDLLSFGARGKVEIDDARLFEVPIVNSLLQVLPLRRPPVFTRAGTDFRIREGQVRLDDLYFYSTPIRLAGEGMLDIDGAANVVLFPEFAPDVPSILVVSELWQALQNQLITFRIEGPLDDPVARVENIVTDIFGNDDEKIVRPILPPFPVAKRDRF